MRPLGHAPDQRVEPGTDLGQVDPRQSGSFQGFGIGSRQLDGNVTIPAPTGGHSANRQVVQPRTISNLLQTELPVNGPLAGGRGGPFGDYLAGRQPSSQAQGPASPGTRGTTRRDAFAPDESTKRVN